MFSILIRLQINTGFQLIFFKTFFLDLILNLLLFVEYMLSLFI